MVGKNYIKLKDYLYNFRVCLKETCESVESYEEAIIRNRVKDLIEHIEMLEEIVEGQMEFDLSLVDKNQIS
jgi:hypothetical protein